MASACPALSCLHPPYLFPRLRAQGSHSRFPICLVRASLQVLYSHYSLPVILPKQLYYLKTPIVVHTFAKRSITMLHYREEWLKQKHHSLPAERRSILPAPPSMPLLWLLSKRRQAPLGCPPSTISAAGKCRLSHLKDGFCIVNPRMVNYFGHLYSTLETDFKAARGD